jgi:hypothetical protein
VRLTGVVDVFGDRVFCFETIAVRSLIMDRVISVAAVEQVLVGVLFVRVAQYRQVAWFLDYLPGIRNCQTRFSI